MWLFEHLYTLHVATFMQTRKKPEGQMYAAIIEWCPPAAVSVDYSPVHRHIQEKICGLRWRCPEIPMLQPIGKSVRKARNVLLRQNIFQWWFAKLVLKNVCKLFFWSIIESMLKQFRFFNDPDLILWEKRLFHGPGVPFWEPPSKAFIHY